MAPGQQRPARRAPAIACALLLLAGGSARGGAPAAAETWFDETRAQTLFAFDGVAIPFTRNLRVEMRRPVKYPGNPVLGRGPAGAPDAWAVQFYGSVLRIGGKFRLWYVAAGDDHGDKSVPRSAAWRVAYAESDDGVAWTRPNLGLVEYRGRTENNLVRLDPAQLGVLNVKVLHEPEDPDPERRYKMTAHVWFAKGDRGNRFGTLVPFVSADGLRWKSVRPLQPVAGEIAREDLFLPWIHFEPAGGLYKWDGIYYAVGQNANVAPEPYHGRVVRAYASGDFLHWTQASAVGFVREPQHQLLGPGRSREGEQAHEGVSVWPRGNVLLGIYGRWHGAPEWSGVTIDLGLVLSHDGITFREPAHEWVLLERGRDGTWDQGGLLQGQGFENVGAQTRLYYGAWDPRGSERAAPRGGLGLATLPRDRFGDLVLEESGRGMGEYQLPEIVAEFVTAAVALPSGRAASFHLNADGLGAEAALKCELLGADLRPLPEYSGVNAARVTRSGFQTPVSWNGRSRLDGLPRRVRVRVTYEGAQQRKIRVSALYVQETYGP